MLARPTHSVSLKAEGGPSPLAPRLGDETAPPSEGPHVQCPPSMNSPDAGSCLCGVHNKKRQIKYCVEVPPHSGRFVCQKGFECKTGSANHELRENVRHEASSGQTAQCVSHQKTRSIECLDEIQPGVLVCKPGARCKMGNQNSYNNYNPIAAAAAAAAAVNHGQLPSDPAAAAAYAAAMAQAHQAIHHQNQGQMNMSNPSPGGHNNDGGMSLGVCVAHNKRRLMKHLGTHPNRPDMLVCLPCHQCK